MSSSRSADASSDPVPVTSPWHGRALAAGLCQAAAAEIPSLPSLPSTLHPCHLSPCPAPIQVSQPAAGIPKKTLRKPSCPLNPSLSCLGNTQTAPTPRNQHPTAKLLLGVQCGTCFKGCRNRFPRQKKALDGFHLLEGIPARLQLSLCCSPRCFCCAQHCGSPGPDCFSDLPSHQTLECCT